MNTQAHCFHATTRRHRLANWLAAVLIASASSFASAQPYLGTGLENLDFVFHENVAANVPVGSNGNGDWPEIDVGTRSKPAFVDIDNDGDLDLFIGESLGTIKFFENTGTGTNAIFVSRSSHPFSGVDVGTEAAPAFGDLDGDGDMDAFIGFFGDSLFYYKNVGNPANAVFALQTGANNPLNAFTPGNGVYMDSYTCPSLTDVNGDGKIDIVVGGHRGYLHYFANTGSATNPAFAARLGADNPFRDIDQNGRSTPFAVDRNGNGRPEGFILGNTGNGNLLVCYRQVSFFYFIPPNENDYPLFNLEVDGQPGPALVDLDGDGDYDLLAGGVSGRLDLYVAHGVGFTGWQGLNFNLPADAAIAGAGADPDGDRIPNLVEYAFGLLPQNADANPFPAALIDSNGHLGQTIQLREDDPKLSVVAEVSNDVLFLSPTTVQPVVSDPDIDDGLKTLTFIDPVPAASASQRYMRFKFSIAP